MSDDFGLERMRRKLEAAFPSTFFLPEPTPLEPLAFVSSAKQELLRLIVDVQQNRNRPEDLS